MIVLADRVFAAGHTATVHYTHAVRSVVMQATLSARADFTEVDGLDPLVRAVAFFPEVVTAGGAIVETPTSLVVADQVAEVHLELIAGNCAAVAVVTQSDTTGTVVGPPEAAIGTTAVSFQRPSNGTTAYRHTVKVYPGGRPVGEDEAVERATATARTIGLDPADLDMVVTTDGIVEGSRHDPRTFGA